jgi:glycosyltransferase involved in cell wall biosynthesis
MIEMPLSKHNKIFRIFSEQILLPFYIKKMKIKAFFNPAYTAPIFSKCKKTTTVHDMIYKHKNDTKRNLIHYFSDFLFDVSIKSSDTIITVSEATKMDLLSFFPDLKNINVTHLGTIPYNSNKEYKPQGINESDPFVLAVGTITPRKNLIRTIQAIELLSDMPHLKLVIAGGINKNSEDVLDYIKKNNLSEKIIITGFLTDNELAWCYKNAEILAFCSLYEGFGLPPLEAMQAGTPVVASNITSIPEVIGDAGILVNPYNPHEIAEAIKTLISNNEIRNTIIETGYKRIQSFTWENTAKKTIEILEKLK